MRKIIDAQALLKNFKVGGNLKDTIMLSEKPVNIMTCGNVQFTGRSLREYVDNNSIEIDHDGWCWDMEKCPKSSKTYIDLLVNQRNGRGIRFQCVPYEEEDDEVSWFSLATDQEVYSEVLAWRLSPSIPKKKVK